MDVQKFDRNPAQAHDVPIWQVARATAAAPTYFKPVEIEGLEYVDGGFGANNPCSEIYDEVNKMNNYAKNCVKIIVSIGTGRNKKISRIQGQGMARYLNFINFAMKWATESERTHQYMLSSNAALKEDEKFHYRRYDVDDGLDAMKLDEWRARHTLRTNLGLCIKKMRSSNRSREKQPVSEKDHYESGNSGNGVLPQAPTVSNEDGSANFEFGHRNSSAINGSRTNEALNQGENMGKEDINPAEDVMDGIPNWLRPKNKTLETIRKCTEAYLAQPDVQVWIENCATILVKGRRDRARSDKTRWEKTCYAAWYQCKVPLCPRGERKYPQEKDMRSHLRHKHGELYDPMKGGHQDIEKMLDTCKKVVL